MLSNETNLRAVIADDEPLARKRLRQLLDDESHIEVIGECSDGREAVQVIREENPDVAFLDIRMPELDGFGVLRELEGAKLPAFVFVTAYDKFAVRAFEVEVVDYLLKPFTRDRLQVAIGRVRRRLQAGASAENAPSLSALLANLNGPPRAIETLMVRSADGMKPLKLSDINCITSAANYAALHVGNSIHLIRVTIAALAGQLPASRFARVSRSCIVNVEQIQEIQRKSHGDFFVVLRNGRRLAGSRSFRQNLLARLDWGRGTTLPSRSRTA
jgi:two-component system LytT family response regulator